MRGLRLLPRFLSWLSVLALLPLLALLALLPLLALLALLPLLALLTLPAGAPVAVALFTAAAMLSGCRLRDQCENPCKSKRAQG